MAKPKIKLGNIDFVLLVTLMILIALGLVMVFSASSYSAYFTRGDAMFFFKRQFVSFILGFIVMIFVINFDYHKLRKFTGILMLVTIALLLVVLKSTSINGATRWINLGFTTVQPSEIAKYTIVAYLAKSISNKGEKMKSFLYGVLPYLLVAGFYAGLVLAEHNLSIASVIVGVTILILIISGTKLWHMFGIVIPSAFALGVVFTLTQPYRVQRLMSFRNPWADSQDTGYQLVQSLLALGSGGITGVGLGKSRQKCYYIPEPHNDFIFAIIGEELGFIGCTLVILLFLVLIWRGIRIAVKAKDTYGTILAVGITSVIAIQAVINIAVVTGSMPVTGVPLPFISYGGSSLLFNLIAMGILLNISRQCETKK